MKRIVQLIALLLCQLAASAQSRETTYTLSFQSRPEGSCNMNYRIDGGKSQAYNNTEKPQIVAGQKVKLELQEAVGCMFDHLLSADTIMDSQREYVSSFGGYHPTTEFVMPAHDVSITAVNTFDPELPEHPGESGWDPETGALVIISFTPGSLEEAINTAITDKNGKKTGEVRRLTVVGKAKINDLSYTRNLKSLEYLDFSRTYDINEVWSGTFTNNTTLKTVLLPASITVIGQMAFEGFSALESFTCFATTPPLLNLYGGKSPFNGCATNLVVYVPAESLPLYAEAEGWKDMELMPITQGVHALTVNMPVGANMQQYKDMFLELANTKTGQTRRYVLTNRTQYTFTNLIEGSQYNVYLKNAREATLGSILAIDIEKSDVKVTFIGLEQPRGITLRLLLPDGSPVDDDDFSITWTDATGNFIANGNIISGQMEGARIIAHVKLGEALGTQYLQPADTLFSVGQNSTLTIALAPLPQATFSGTVTASATGEPIREANIAVTQLLNALYPMTHYTTTDNDGHWTLSAYDMPAAIVAQVNGYMPQQISHNPSQGRVINLALDELTGTSILLKFSYIPAVRPGEEPDTDATFNGLDNMDYTVYDETHAKDLSADVVAETGRLVLQGHDLAQGTKLRITATSPTQLFMPVDATTTVDADGNATARLKLTQLGQLRASFAQTDNSDVVGMLYDADGLLKGTFYYDMAKLNIIDIPDGSYTLVTMGESRMFNGVNSLNALTEMHLEENRDYIKNVVDIHSGRIDSLHNERVPMLDETVFNYTTENTHFTANKTSITVGNFVTLRTQLDFKAGVTPQDVQLIFDLPEGCSLVEGSVMAGNSLAQYETDDHRVTVPLNSVSDIVRFCVMPTEEGHYQPTATVSFNNGRHVVQPLGSVTFIAGALSINVPERVSRGRVPVSGTAIAGSKVDIYGDGLLIGHTEAGPDGSWSMRCSLNGAYNLSEHAVYAVITTTDGINLRTGTATVIVSHGAVTPVVHAQPSGMNYEIEWDFRDFTVTPRHCAWPLGPGILPFTFKVDFYNEDNVMVNDPKLISEVTLYVQLSDDSYVVLKAPYNEQNRKWTAQADFSIDASPKNVFVDFLQDVTIKADREELDQMRADLASSREEARLMAKEVYDLSEKDIVIDEQPLFDELQQLLATANADEASWTRINELIDLLTDDINETPSEPANPQEIDATIAKFDEWNSQWRDRMLSLLSYANSTDTIARTFNEEEECQYDVPIGNGSVHCSSKKLANVNEQALLEEGYRKTDMTDGTVIYMLRTDDKESYIDTRTHMQYSFEWQGRAAAKKLSRRLNPVEIDNIFDMVEKARFDSLHSEVLYTIVREYPMSEAKIATEVYLGKVLNLCRQLAVSTNNLYISGLETIKKQIYPIYFNEIDSFEQTIKYYNDEVIPKRKKDLDKIRKKPYYPGKPYDVNAASAKLNEAKDKLKYFESQKKQTENIKRYLAAVLSKLPNNLDNARKEAWVYNEALDMANTPIGMLYWLYWSYFETTAVRDDLEGWQETYNAIKAKIPCKGNEDEALAIFAQTVSGIVGNGKPEAHDVWFVASHVSLAGYNEFNKVVDGYIPHTSVALSWFVNTWAADNSNFEQSVPAQFISVAGGFPQLYYASQQSQLSRSKNERKRLDARIRKLKCKEPDPKPETEVTKPVKPGTDGNFSIRFSPFFAIDFYHDPSGYVYEAVNSNRLEGVLATCYYKETKEDMYGDLHDDIILWNAEEYAQENPLFTDSEGMYRWDVPQGLWQVKYEKEGYETTYSEWLPVPPPQLEVNIGMTQLRQPAVQHVKACTEGIDITFDKYMRPKTLNTANILVTKGGQTVGGRIELLNSDNGYETPDSAYASKLRFIPAQPFNVNDKVQLTVRRQVESYAGLQMEQDFTQQFDVEQRIEGIIVDSLIYLSEGNEQALVVKAIPAEAAKGKQLKVTSLATDVVTVSNDALTLDQNGQAQLTLTAASLGSGAVRLTLADDDELSATTMVIVRDPAMMFVFAPKASRMSGTEIYRGSQIKLSSATAGATILYTLDGSCPCDLQSASVFTYTSPILATGTELVIRAMAVANGMAESDVVEFRYKVIDNIVGIEPIHDTQTFNRTPTAYYRIDGRRVDKLQRGLNIIRYPDGTVRKVFVK